MINLDTANVATGLVLLIAVVGAAMVVISAVVDGVDPALRVSFNQYIDGVGVAAGLLAIGRGLKARNETTRRR